MPPTDLGRVLGQDDLVTILRRYSALLVRDESRLNEMNVFPLADRDTGTNLVRTMSSLVEALERTPAPGPGPGSISGSGGGAGPVAAAPVSSPVEAPLAARAAAAALESARGNSGLIASQYLAGLLAETDVDIDTGQEPGTSDGGGTDEVIGTSDGGGPVLDGMWFSAALSRAAVEARAAVAEPVEGTMITVADRVADAVTVVLGSLAEPADADLTGLATVALGAATVAVAATPSQLPVLAEAGVVDAGGAGLALLFEALVDHLSHGSPHAPDGGVPLPARAGGPTTTRTPSGTLAGFELQFTFDGSRAEAAAVRRMLGEWGREVVVTWAGGVARAHVHLDGSDLGPALEAVGAVVSARTIGVEALVETIGL